MPVIMRPQMKCCANPDIRWIARDGQGRIVRAYRCENCLATDRPVSESTPRIVRGRLDKIDRIRRSRTARINARLSEIGRGSSGATKRYLRAQAKKEVSA